MIDKLSYEQLQEIIGNFREQLDIIQKLMKGRSVPELADFIDSVETYCKFLENTMELNKDADEALSELVK